MRSSLLLANQVDVLPKAKPCAGLFEQLKGIRCLSTIANRKTNKNIDVLSCPDAIARAIEDALGEDCELAGVLAVNKCPDCGQPLRKEAGCSFCDNDDCAYFKCG